MSNPLKFTKISYLSKLNYETFQVTGNKGEVLN